MRPNSIPVALSMMCFGASLLWILRVYYGLFRPHSDDTMRLVLSLGGKIMFIAGAIGASLVSFHIASILVIPVVGFFAVRAWGDFALHERRMLLDALSAAIRHKIPISAAARAVAFEQTSNGQRTARFATLLEAGVPFANALQMTGLKLDPEMLVAARIASETGDMQGFISPKRSELEMGRASARMGETLFYLCSTALAGTLIIAFVMLRIVPVFKKMFEEFELRLPASTELLIAVGDYFVRYLWIPIVCLAVPVAVVGILFVSTRYLFEFFESLGQNVDGIPLANLVRRGRDRRLTLKFLGRLLGRSLPIPAALDLLSRVYPRKWVRERLKIVLGRVRNGSDWCEALSETGFISPAEKALIKSSDRLGHIPWTLSEIAESRLRRESYWIEIITSIIQPLIMLIAGLVVGFVVIALFMPLVSLIVSLTY